MFLFHLTVLLSSTCERRLAQRLVYHETTDATDALDALSTWAQQVSFSRDNDFWGMWFWCGAKHHLHILRTNFVVHEQAFSSSCLFVFVSCLTLASSCRMKSAQVVGLQARGSVWASEHYEFNSRLQKIMCVIHWIISCPSGYRDLIWMQTRAAFFPLSFPPPIPDIDVWKWLGLLAPAVFFDIL